MGSLIEELQYCGLNGNPYKQLGLISVDHTSMSMSFHNPHMEPLEPTVFREGPPAWKEVIRSELASKGIPHDVIKKITRFAADETWLSYRRADGAPIFRQFYH